MIQDAIAEIREFEKMRQELKAAQSTAEKLAVMRKIEMFENIVLPILADALEEELDLLLTK
jgi:hypothetical protein